MTLADVLVRTAQNEREEVRKVRSGIEEDFRRMEAEGRPLSEIRTKLLAQYREEYGAMAILRAINAM